MKNKCIMCGAIIPEGTSFCPNCFNKYSKKSDENQDAKADVGNLCRKKSYTKSKRFAVSV